MEAVDAAVGPEVDEDDFAAEVAVNRERVRVEPRVAGWKVRDPKNLLVCYTQRLLLPDELVHNFQIPLRKYVLAILVLLQE